MQSWISFTKTLALTKGYMHSKPVDCYQVFIMVCITTYIAGYVATYMNHALL